MGSKLTKEIFIQRSIEKHRNVYDYSKVDYINTKTKVIIICTEHGEFTQSAGKHLIGQGQGVLVQYLTLLLLLKIQ